MQMTKLSVLQDFKRPVMKLSKPISTMVFQTHQTNSMIFRTINDDADRLTKKIGLLNKSFYDIKKDFSNGIGIKDSLFKTGISEKELSSLKSFNNAIKNTNDGLTKSQRVTKAWNDNMGGCSIAAKRLGNDLVTGKKKIQDINVSMKSATLSTKALGVAMNIASNVAFMLAVSAVTKVITEMAQAQSKAVESAQEATETYKDEIKSIDDYKQKISELQTELNAGNLSYEDAKTKRSELMSIQDELINRYGTEKSAIESITTAIGGQVDALDSLNESQYREWLAKADKQSIWNKLTPGGKSGLDQAIDFMETDKTVSIMDMQNANLSDDLQEIQKEIDDTIQSKYNLEKVFATFNVSGTPEEIKSTLENIRQDYMDLSKDAFIENGISSDLWETYRAEAVDSINEVISKYDEGIQKHQDTYQTYMEGKIKYDSDYSDEYENILAKRANLEEAELSGDADAIAKTRQEMMNAINAGVISAGDNDNLKKYFENLYPELQAEFSKWTFEFDLKANTDNLGNEAKELGEKYTAIDLLDMVNTDGVQDGEDAFDSLIDKAIEYGVCTDNSSEEVQKLIDLLVELGIVQREVQDSTLNNEPPVSATDFLSQIQALSKGLDQLGKIYLDVKDKKDFDWSSILNNEAFTEEFGNMENATEAYKNTYEEFIQTVSNSPTDIKACQSAFDDLATAYIYNSGALQNVTDETKAATVAMLKQMGVANADAVVTAALTAKQLYLKLNLDDSTESIYAQISGLLEHSNASDIAKASLFNLIAEEQIFSNTNLDTAGKIAQLEQLGLAFGITADAAHSSASAIEAVRFAGRAGGKAAAERTEKEIYEQNSSWYRDQISKKYASISVNYKAPGGSGKSGKGKSGKGSGSSSKQEYKETIDWAEKTITLLTNKINLLNAKLDNTTSYKNQIKYIKKLADAQENLIQVYDKVESARSKLYKTSLKKLSKTDRKKVESGAYTVENIKWVKSSDSKGTAKNEKRYQNIKEALEARDSLAKTQQDYTKAKTQLKKLASDLADKTWEKATNSLEKYNHQMDLLDKKLSNTASFKSKNKLLAKQLDLEQKILSAKEKALSVEKQEAISIGNKIKKGYKKLSSSKKEKIDKSLKSKTKIDISSLGINPSSSLYQLMIQYNAFIDKLIEETSNLEIDKQEAISSINEKAQSIIDNIWDEAMAKVESLSNEIESLDKVLANTDGFKERNKILEEMIRLTEKSIEAAKQGVQDEKKKTVLYDKNIKNELAKDKKRKKKKISSKDTKVIETAIKSGKKINAKELSSVKVDSELYKNIIKHNKSIDSTKEKRKIYQDNKQDGISDINQRILDKYSSIQDYYEQISNKIQSDADKLNGLISLAEAKGQATSKTYYQELQKFENNKTKDLVKEKKELEKQLESDIKLGRIEIYSSKWYEAIATIQDCEKAILDSGLATEEFNNSIRELDWSKFDQLISKLEEISKESNFLIGLFDKDNMFDDNGVINLDGLTAQGLYAQNHNVYMEESKKYAEEIKKIDESLAKDPYNKTLLDRRNELLSAQQQAITNAKSEKDSIISLVEEGYKKKVDALSELVSKQQELLDKEKELHDYEKSIRNKSGNITMLEKQIQALSLSTDRADIAKRLQLEEELKNSKEDLEEEQYQHSISSQKDALSNALNDYKKQIDDYLKDRDKVFEDALSEVNAYHSSILTNIENKAQSVGYKISDSLIHVWSNTNPVSNYTNTVIDSMNGVGEALDNVIAKLQDMYQYYEKIAKENINTTFKDSNNLTTSAKIRDILGEASGKNGASNKGTSELNKYLASLGYGYLDQDGMVNLAKALNIKGMDSIEGIRENGGTSVIVDELKKHISSNKNTLSELDKQGKVSASNVKKTMDLIHGASTYTDKRDKLSDLNKYIYDNYDKKYLTKSQMVKLAKYLGETSVKDTSDLTDKAKIKLLDKLKAASFSKGGIVEFVRQTGEDGISLVRRGEGILSQEQVEVFRKSIPIMNHVTQQLDINKNLVPVQRDMSNIIKITSPLVEVRGNLDNVTKKELENAIGNVPNMLVSQMNKYGSRGGNLRK